MKDTESSWEDIFDWKQVPEAQEDTCSPLPNGGNRRVSDISFFASVINEKTNETISYPNKSVYGAVILPEAGDIVWAFVPIVGGTSNRPAKVRPVVVVSSPLIDTRREVTSYYVAPLSRTATLEDTHCRVRVKSSLKNNLRQDSIILGDHLHKVGSEFITSKIGELEEEYKHELGTLLTRLVVGGLNTHE